MILLATAPANVTRMEKPRTILMLAFPGAQMLDVVGPLQMFAGANDELKRQAYRILIAAPQAGPFATSSGMSLVADLSLSRLTARRLSTVHTLMVTGAGRTSPPRSRRVRRPQWLCGRRHAIAARIGVQRGVHPGGGRRARWAPRRHALEFRGRIAPIPAGCPGRGRCHPRRGPRSLELRRRHRRNGPGPCDDRGRPRPCRGARHRPQACHFPRAARRQSQFSSELIAQEVDDRGRRALRARSRPIRA